MAVNFGAASSANGNVLSAMPTHSTNNLLLMFAFNGNGGSTPTLPSGWIERISTNGNNRSMILGWRHATSSATASGTWTNATQLACAVYNSDSGLYLIPGHANATNGLSGTISYVALDALLRFSKTPSSWVVGASGTEVNTTADTPPTGMTNRTSAVSTSEIALHDTNAAAAWTTQQNVTCAANTRFSTILVEVYETAIAISSGGGGGSRAYSFGV